MDGKSVWSVTKDQQYTDSRLGCCLQFDALDDFLTGKEHLQLYLRLRNDMSEEDINEIVDETLERMNLVEHTNK